MAAELGRMSIPSSIVRRKGEPDHDYPFDEGWPMNVTLWFLQALLAVAFAAHGWMLLSPPPELLAIMNEQLGVGFRLFLGFAEIAGAIGVLLPAMTRVMPWLTPAAAGCLAFVVASATVLHLSRGETSSAATTAILFLLAACVAYARWRVRPIRTRSGSRSATRATATGTHLNGEPT